MPSKKKRLLAAVTAAASLALAAPATATATATATEAAVIGPCQVRPLGGVQEWYQEVLVTGEAAPPGALHTDLWCGVVRYGETVALVPDSFTGPVAAIAEVTSVHAGPIGSCYVLRVIYIEGITYTDTCP